MVGFGNNSHSCNNAHLKACFIKIPNIFIKNPILYFYVLNTFKLALNKYM